jgi:hypothetical protein
VVGVGKMQSKLENLLYVVKAMNSQPHQNAQSRRWKASNGLVK